MTKRNNDVDLKIPPHSIEAEQSVLGGLLLDNSVWKKIESTLSESDFYLPAHKRIFMVIREMANSGGPYDILTLIEFLEKMCASGFPSLKEVGGKQYLFELAKNTPSAANIAAYADVVRERSVLRQLIDIGGIIIKQSYDANGIDAEKLLDDAKEKVSQIAKIKKNNSRSDQIQELIQKANHEQLSENEKNLLQNLLGDKNNIHTLEPEYSRGLFHIERYIYDEMIDMEENLKALREIMRMLEKFRTGSEITTDEFWASNVVPQV